MRLPNLYEALMAGCRVIKAKFTRQAVLLDDETVNERLAACEACPFFDPGIRQCNACTCLVDLKAALATEKCPKRRWPVTNK